MAKYTLEEFKNKYNEKITDNDDLLIELMEDLEDSIVVENVDKIEELETKIEELKSEIELKKSEVEDLKRRYKERFLERDNKKDEEIDNEVGLKEKEVIDIKEI